MGQNCTPLRSVHLFVTDAALRELIYNCLQGFPSPYPPANWRCRRRATLTVLGITQEGGVINIDHPEFLPGWNIEGDSFVVYPLGSVAEQRVPGHPPTYFQREPDGTTYAVTWDLADRITRGFVHYAEEDDINELAHQVDAWKRRVKGFVTLALRTETEKVGGPLSKTEIEL